MDFIMIGFILLLLFVGWKDLLDLACQLDVLVALRICQEKKSSK